MKFYRTSNVPFRIKFIWLLPKLFTVMYGIYGDLKSNTTWQFVFSDCAFFFNHPCSTTKKLYMWTVPTECGTITKIINIFKFLFVYLSQRPSLSRVGYHNWKNMPLPCLGTHSGSSCQEFLRKTTASLRHNEIIEVAQIPRHT